MISGNELEHLFVDRGTTEAGRALIRAARADGPARQIQRRYDTVRTLFVSEKMGGQQLLAESRTVEFPAMYFHERDPAVLEYWPQPCTVDLFVDGAKGGRTRLAHTPDMLVVSSTLSC